MFARFSFKVYSSRGSRILMQSIVYGFSELSANTMHLYKIVNASATHALQATELPQQFPALLRAQAGNLFQLRGATCFRSLLPMSGYRESMRLVPDLFLFIAAECTSHRGGVVRYRCHYRPD